MTLKSFATAVWLGTLASNADTVFGPTTNNNALVVRTNEAIVLTAFVGGYFVDAKSNVTINSSFRITANTPQVQASVDFDVHNPVYGRSPFPLPIAGPIDLSIPTNTFLSFSRIGRGAIETAIVSAKRHYTIIVPTNRAVFFFKPSTFRVEALFGQEKRSVVGRIYGGEQFDGPLSITLRLPTGTSDSANTLVSFFVSDQLQGADNDIVVGGTLDVFPIIIERSFDLRSWMPIGTNSTKTAGGRAFFRLTVPHR